MATKSPQRSGSKKKASRSLKEKRMAKRAKRAEANRPTVLDEEQ
jgi:hypothetical protein